MPGLTARPARLRPAQSGQAAVTCLGRAERALLEAAGSADDATRYAGAHVAALRTAAAVLAVRTRPHPRGERNAWVLLTRVAPELAEWAAFFAAGAPKRAAAEAGLTAVVTTREADDLVRDAEAFLRVVEQLLDLPRQPVLPHEEARVRHG